MTRKGGLALLLIFPRVLRVLRAIPSLQWRLISLTFVTIPASVTNIGGRALSGSTNLVTIYFEGNAPTVGSSVFAGDTDATAYHLPGTTGWAEFSSVFETDLPTVPWNPLGASGGVSLGVQSNQFAFSFTGPANLVVVVEACTDLANPVWVPIQTNALTNGSFNFSDPHWTNFPGRYYRISSP
jgi:hypothetical protein